MHPRLQAVLAELRYDPTTKSGMRIALLFAVQSHARMIGDDEMVAACEEVILAVRAEARAAPAAEPPASAPQPPSQDV